MQTPNVVRRQAHAPFIWGGAGVSWLLLCLRQTFATHTVAFVRRLLQRPRRLRRSLALRNLVRETQLSVHDFVLPLFVSEKVEQRRPIASMPGVFQLSVRE